MVLIFLISDESEPFLRNFKILPCGCLSDFQSSSILCCPLLAILGIESRASWMLGILPQSYIPSLHSPFPCVWWGVMPLSMHVEVRGQAFSSIILHLTCWELNCQSDRLEASLDSLPCNDNGVRVCAAMPVFMWVLWIWTWASFTPRAISTDHFL